MWNDTIVARATAEGNGAIGIIRVSGNEAHAMARQIIPSFPGLDSIKPRRVYMAEVFDARNELIDELVYIPFRGPKSYTGEDIVELYCHGNNILIDMIITLFVNAGARLAMPGEYTRRAFMNGKMDLAQAESVCDIISAETEQQIKAAASMLSGAFGIRIHNIRQDMILLISWAEASIDFPEEEDAASQQQHDFLAKLDTLMRDIENLKDSYTEGRLIREGTLVTIAGDTNVGKSSLMNALFEEEKSIVTPIHGTTRDVVEGSLRIGGIKMIIRDTAGLRTPEGVVEEEGIRRARKSIEQADVVLYVIDAQKEDISSDLKQLEQITRNDKFCIVIVNKIDLRSTDDIAWYPSISQQHCCVSALQHEGIRAIKELLYGFAARHIDKAHNFEYTVNQRQFISLSQGLEALRQARQACEGNMSEEFVVEHLKEASSALGAIIGEVSAEDILDKIFSSFCIGK